MTWVVYAAAAFVAAALYLYVYLALVDLVAPCPVENCDGQIRCQRPTAVVECPACGAEVWIAAATAAEVEVVE